MVKPTSSSSSSSSSLMMSASSSLQQRGNNGDEIKYKGVRKRKWGKWVSEIRLPNSRERIWLGSYDSPEKAARAFDVALFCLRGPNAKFNFPENPPVVEGGQSLTPQEIQEVASQIANNEEEEEEQSADLNTAVAAAVAPPAGGGDGFQACSSSQQLRGMETEDASFSSALPPRTDAIDWSFLDMLDSNSYGNGVAGASSDAFQDFGLYSGFDHMQFDNMSCDMYMPQLVSPKHYDNGGDDDDDGDGGGADDGSSGGAHYSSSSFLWNF